MNQWKMYILPYIWGPVLVTQFIIVFFFGVYNKAGLDVVMYVGWLIWVISIIFGWLPIFIFKRRGGVPKRKSFVYTTILVENGLYSIVRHPQYTAGILFSLSLILISQSLIITTMGIVVISLLYFDILLADKHEVKKFGDEYIRYMKKVPRTNFILGIVRLLIRRKEKENTRHG